MPSGYWSLNAVYDAVNIGYTGTGLSDVLSLSELSSFWNSDETTNSRYY